MKMLTIAIILMLVPFASHAERNSHFKHRKHEQQQNNSYFWKNVDRRQYKQEGRIERGINKGQLTRREAKKLHKEQKHVAKQIRHFQRHNHLSRRDKREVMEHLDYVSDKIRILKHNQHYVHRNQYKHKKSTRHVHSNNNDRNYYRNDRYVSWVNNDLQAGLYFRF